MPAEAVITRSGIDFSMPFYPARLTTLAFTPSWQRLGENHKLHYPQLYALYLNEQTLFFEETLATNVLSAIYRRPGIAGTALADDLPRFEEEEKRHSRWFRELNHKVDPRRSSLEKGTYVFIPAGKGTRTISSWLTQRPFTLACWIWLMLIQEERSIAISRECLREGDRMEPHFLALHRKHMADEAGHVELCLKLIETIWLPMPKWKRRIQARFSGMMMAEFFTVPKRSAKTLLDALILDFSELEPMRTDLHKELAELADSDEYHASLYGRRMTPRCFALFDELPEFHDIGRYLPAYQKP